MPAGKERVIGSIPWMHWSLTLAPSSKVSPLLLIIQWLTQVTWSALTSPQQEGQSYHVLEGERAEIFVISHTNLHPTPCTESTVPDSWSPASLPGTNVYTTHKNQVNPTTHHSMTMTLLCTHPPLSLLMAPTYWNTLSLSLILLTLQEFTYS